MKTMKWFAGLVVAVALTMGVLSASAAIDKEGTQAPAGASEDATRKCPPFC